MQEITDRYNEMTLENDPLVLRASIFRDTEDVTELFPRIQFTCELYGATLFTWVTDSGVSSAKWEELASQHAEIIFNNWNGNQSISICHDVVRFEILGDHGISNIELPRNVCADAFAEAGLLTRKWVIRDSPRGLREI